MFKSILVANRGEIACRIMRTAKRMGLRTIAVYSDADKNALHVREADEAVHIGPPPPSESYLQIDRIIDAALKSGAEAIHPGYGFLSENTKFAEALAKTGITFVGPDASCIAPYTFPAHLFCPAFSSRKYISKGISDPNIQSFPYLNRYFQVFRLQFVNQPSRT